VAKEDTIVLKGVSGKSYDFDVYPWNTSFKPVGAVYAVLKKTNSNYTVIYIGQTGNLSERFDNHHKLSCFNRNGKTHVAIHLDSSESSQLAKERDLVANYSPVCNG